MYYFDESSIKKHRNQSELFMTTRTVPKCGKKSISRSTSKNPNSDRIYKINQEKHKRKKEKERACSSSRHGT